MYTYFIIPSFLECMRLHQSPYFPYREIVPALAAELTTLIWYERYENIDQAAKKKRRQRRRRALKKKKRQLFKTRGTGLAHSFLMLHLHNVKCFHTKDKIRISLRVKTSMIFFRNHKSTRNHFQRKHFCLEKAKKIQTSLLVFTNAGFNKFLQEVLYKLFQKNK